jgi:hypothetical protein
MSNKIVLPVFAAVLALLVVASCADSTGACQPQGTANVLAPWYCSQINQAVSADWAEWLPLAMATISLAFLIAAAIFMVGMAMRNDKVKNFGVGELYEASATALIAIFFLTLTAILFGIIPAFVTGPINPYDTSLTYISGIMSASQGVMKNLYGLIMIDSYYASISLDVVLPGTQLNSATGEIAEGAEGVVGSGLGNQAISGLASLGSGIMMFFILPATAVGKLIGDGMMALSAEFYIIYFFLYLAIPVFLIPGILLRAIFPLRGIGGMLIGIAVAFYVVMPLLFSVAYYFTNTSVIGSLDASAAALAVHGQGTLAQTNAATATSPLVTDVNGLESSMGAYFLAVLFYPALIIAISYVAMREIAEFIGGVSKMSGKMKML